MRLTIRDGLATIAVAAARAASAVAQPLVVTRPAGLLVQIGQGGAPTG